MNAYVTVAVSTLGAVFIAWTSYRIARRDPRPTFNVEGNSAVGGSDSIASNDVGPFPKVTPLQAG